MANVLLGIHCVVAGCGSTLKRLNQWKAKPCSKPKHNGKAHAQCMCPEPYQFFKFPSEVKLQKLWLERVKRPDLEVNNLTRVCSLHFVEGKPTRRNYFPNMNIRQEEDEAYNEDEEMVIEGQQYYNAAEEEIVVGPSESKKGKSGTVSIVPMDLLQEQRGDTADDQVGDEGYEGDLTISRFNYHGSEEGVYEMPTNSVTITRVTSIPATAACTKPANRFINTKKARVEGSSGGNRFLKDRGTSGSSLVNVVRSNRPQSSSAVPQQSRSSNLTNSKSPSNLLRTVSLHPNKAEQSHQQEHNNCPYEIDMVVDEDDDSSELSDIGINIQPTSLMKQKYTSKDLSTAKTLSSLIRQRVSLPTSAPPTKELASVSKPKMIPVLAVAPKSQLQFQQQGTILQPVQVISRTVNASLTAQQNKKPSSANNVLASTTTANALSRPLVTTSGAGSSISNNITQAIIAISGSSSIKTEASTSVVAPATSSSSAQPNINSNSTEQPNPAPSLATYDPSKQQLQIANPVKYIQECHTRIAQLLADKQSLESRNTELEARVQELQKSNNDLRREIVHQALNAARRTPPQLNTPTFNLIPTAIMDANSVSPANQNGSSSMDGTSGGNKPRIRYVIRRPANLTGGTNSTK